MIWVFWWPELIVISKQISADFPYFTQYLARILSLKHTSNVYFQQGCQSVPMGSNVMAWPIRTNQDIYFHFSPHRSVVFFQFQCAKHHGNPGYRLSVFSWLSGAFEQRRVTIVRTDALAACRYEALIHSHRMNWYSSPCGLACHRKANTCRCFDAEHLRKNRIDFLPFSWVAVSLGTLFYYAKAGKSFPVSLTSFFCRYNS